MRQFLVAIAQSLRNLGIEDAIADGESVHLHGICFHVRTHWNRKSFTFCGRTYRYGNVKQAVLDLLQSLPEMLARRDRELELRRRDLQLKALNESLVSSGVTIVRSGDSYELRYTADLNQLATLAQQIANAEAISFAAIDTMLDKLSATFDAEGGFSLN